MQIYTRILLGMAVGAVIGLTLGPTSRFLPHDLYRFSDASKATVFLDRADPASQVTFPKVAVSIRALETFKSEVKDTSGQPHEVATWVRGRFRVSKQLALQADKATLAALDKKAGQTAEVWLKLSVKPFEHHVMVLPVPISRIGWSIINWLRPIGTLFMRLLKMVIVPLVFSSLLVGVASLGDIRKLGRMGGKTLGLYLITTAIAVTIGLGCARLINPGGYVGKAEKLALQSQFEEGANSKKEAAAKAPTAIDNILAIVPTNPVDSLANGRMLQIIFFAILFGVSLTLMGAAESKLVVSFFDKVQQAMVLIIHMIMTLAPFGVAALIAEVIGTSGASVLGALVIYSLTVLLGLFIHATLIYGGLIRLLTPLPLLRFMRAIRPAQLVAFSTSSSSATLPVSMEVAEESLGISSPVASFVLPLGSTVNMDGTALYQGVAAVFIAQVFDIHLGLGEQLGIVLTATMASIGAAGVPGAGMVTLAMVLTATGIPAVGVALILGMDRILDMFRTAVNVTGDLAVTTVMAATEGETMTPLDPIDDFADPNRGFESRLHHHPEAVDPDR